VTNYIFGGRIILKCVGWPSVDWTNDGICEHNSENYGHIK